MTQTSEGSRIRYLLSTPSEIQGILLVSSAVLFLTELAYYLFYVTHLHGIVDLYNEPFGRDFISYWTAISLLKDGDVSGIYSGPVFAATMRALMGRDIGMYWGYPPHYLFLLWPFTFIASYKLAYAVWTLLNLSVFLFAAFWRTKLSASWRLIMLGAPVVFVELFIGQNGLITSALLIGGFRLLAARPALAGLLFGLLSFKPQLGILIPFILLALRQYKAFFVAALTVAALVDASVLVFGWPSWTGFFYDMTHFPQGAFNKMISVSAAARSLGFSISAGLALQAVVAMLVMLVLYYRLSKMQQAHWSDWLRLAMPAVFLVTPYTFPYDLGALTTAWLLWLAGQGEKKVSAFATSLWLALWYSPFFSESLNNHKLPLTPLFIATLFFLAWKEKGIADNASA